nr:hypothetical protein [Tanacetum cinerariifolium]
SKDTSCVSNTQNQLSQKLENANVELEFQVLNCAQENAHLKATYKNLFDSISVSRVQTETKIASLQNELQCNIYKNAKLRTQLFNKVSDQKDNTQDSSVNNAKVIAPGMFRISLDNVSRDAKKVPNTDVDELNPNAMVDGNTFVNPFAISSISAAQATSSSQNVDPSNMHTFYQPYPHEFQW